MLARFAGHLGGHFGVATPTRMFHSSAAMHGLAKKKLKPKRVHLVNGVPHWVIKKEFIQKQVGVLEKKLEKLVNQDVIHMPEPSLQAWVTTLEQEPIELVDLDPEVFGQELRKDIVHRVVRWQRNAWRAGTSKGKQRREKRGGGRKPRPQKGGGVARQGSIRAPNFVGGGKAFPPLGNGDFSHDLPKKVIKKGVAIALSAKFQEGNLYIVDGCTAENPKTAEVVAKFNQWDIGNVAFIHGLTELDPNFALACRNLNFLELYNPADIGVYQILKRHQVFITRQGLRELELHLTKLPNHRPANRVLNTVEGFTPLSLTESFLARAESQSA